MRCWRASRQWPPPAGRKGCRQAGWSGTRSRAAKHGLQAGRARSSGRAAVPRGCVAVMAVGGRQLAARWWVQCGASKREGRQALRCKRQPCLAAPSPGAPTGTVLLSKVTVKSCFMARPREVRMPSGPCSAASWLTLYALQTIFVCVEGGARGSRGRRGQGTLQAACTCAAGAPTGRSLQQPCHSPARRQLAHAGWAGALTPRAADGTAPRCKSPPAAASARRCR